MSDELEPLEPRFEVLPPARSELDEESTIRLTNGEAWALWEYFEHSDSLPYWDHGLRNVGSRLKRWVIEEAPWGEPEPREDVARRPRP